MQWLNTLCPCGDEELALVTDSLFAELAEKNVDIVDAGTLAAVFSPLVTASRDQFEEEIAKHRQLISTMYGEDAVRAFSQVPLDEMPIVLESMRAQEVDHLQGTVEHERQLREEVERTSALTAKEKEELAKLRYEKKERNRRAKNKSHPKGRKK